MSWGRTVLLQSVINMGEVTCISETLYQLNKYFASFWKGVNTEKKQKGEYEILRKLGASWVSY